MKKQSRLGSPHLLGALLAVLAVAIGYTAYLYYRGQKDHLKRQEQDELRAIADTKVKEIADWRKERHRDAAVIFSNPMVARSVRQLLAGEPGRSEEELRIWAQALKQRRDYTDVLILDPAGRLRLAIPSEAHPPSGHVLALAAEALRTRTVVLSDLHWAESSEDIQLALLVPVLAPAPETVPVSVIVLLIDPYRFLYPLVRAWPTPSSSAETLLVRRDGDHVLFLNELRHRKHTALSLRLPLSRRDLPAAMGLLGREGLVEGLDYRGVPVLAALKRVPDSPWLMVAKVNTEEVYAPIRERARWTAMLVVLLVAGLAAGVGLLWRQQQARFYRQQYEAELEKYALAKHYDYITRFTNDIFLMLDGNGRIVEANDRAVASYGHTREELLRLNIRDLRAPETLADFERQWKQVEEQSGLLFETVHRRKDRSAFPVEVSSRLIEVEGARFRQSIIRDITERTRAEQELRRADEELRKREAQLTQAQELAGLGSWEWDLGANQVTWSEELCALLGWRNEQVSCSFEAFLKRVKPDDRGHVRRVIEDGLRSSQPFGYQHRIIRPDGSVRVLRARAETVFDDAGKPIKMFGVAQDVTEAEQAEEALRQAQKLESIGVLAGGVAHDFNNLLTGVIGNASLALDERVSPEAAERIEAIREAGQRAAELTRQLLAYAGKGQFLVQDLSLSKVVAEMTKLLEFSIPKTVELRLALGDDLPSVRADASQIQQVVMNLVINAAEAHEDGRCGAVLVGTGVEEFRQSFLDDLGQRVAPGGYVCLEVIDTGCGMDEETRSRIFDPFFTTKFVGRGLGLAAVQGIVRSCGGGIQILSAPGMGSTFKVFFPAAQARIDTGPASTEDRYHLPGAGTILLVDDEDMVRKFARIALEKCGYTVLAASNGREALALLAEHGGQVRLAVVDLIMPVMGGRETVIQMRSRWPALKVILTSGYSDAEAQRLCPVFGIAAFLQKPYSRQALAATIGKVLEEEPVCR